ncbi:MAG: hypothetical protein ACJ798_17280 [Phenylobacterium sp.]
MPRSIPILFAMATLALAPCAAAQDHSQHVGHARPQPADSPATSGQAAFAALADAVDRLSADPSTDWSKANLGALREHLVDMDNVFLRARVTTTPTPGGARFDIKGDGPVVGAIQRMVAGHAAMASGEEGRRIEATLSESGAMMTVTTADPAGEAQIRALGFFGLLASGAHHQPHHLMLARGEAMAH